MDTENYPTWGSHVEVGVEPISALEVHDLAEDWFRAVQRKRPVDERRRFFAPGVRIQAWDGSSFDLDEYARLHEKWVEESHHILSLDVQPLGDRTSRVLAKVVVGWDATVRGARSGARRVRALIGEEWVVEHGPAGGARFARYLQVTFKPVPGSAPVDLSLG